MIEIRDEISVPAPVAQVWRNSHSGRPRALAPVRDAHRRRPRPVRVPALPRPNRQERRDDGRVRVRSLAGEPHRVEDHDGQHRILADGRRLVGGFRPNSPRRGDNARHGREQLPTPRSDDSPHASSDPVEISPDPASDSEGPRRIPQLRIELVNRRGTDSRLTREPGW